jgi:acetylglutamate kinase
VTAGAVLLKLGGELLEQPMGLKAIAQVIASASGPLVVVHGGGKEIDRALARAGIVKNQVDGIRVTDPATLEIVIEVLAGAVNTRLVAAINAAGGRAVGLTGVDGGLVPVAPAAAHRAVDGSVVDLGRVGTPTGKGRPTLAANLLASGYIPVVASIAAGDDGLLYNVNADTLAGDLAARLGVKRLVIAGGTPGVLDESGQTIPDLDERDVERVIGSGVASAGMVAKLGACRDAIAGGVDEVLLVDGKDVVALGAAIAGEPARRGQTLLRGSDAVKQITKS